jgi:hypothetical protein
VHHIASSRALTERDRLEINFKTAQKIQIKLRFVSVHNRDEELEFFEIGRGGLRRSPFAWFFR